MASGDNISCQGYINALVTQTPYFDKTMVMDERPGTAGLRGFYATEGYDAYTNNQHIFDRLRSVFPDLTQPWYQPASQPTVGADGSVPNAENAQDCSPNNCDLPANTMTWGSTRLGYGLWRQQWRSAIQCFDELMSKTKAKEHFGQIVGSVLPQASEFIVNDLLLKLCLFNSQTSIPCGGIGPQVCIGGSLVPLTSWSWDSGGSTSVSGAYGFKYLNTSADPTSKVTPLHLQQQVNPQIGLGALKNPFSDSLGKLQYHTDNDSLYSMIQGNSTINDRVRYNDAAAFPTGAKEFYKYGFTGTVGDFMVKCLPHLLRFNQVSPGRYQTVLPYVNAPTTTGFGDSYNQAYNNAQYQLSYINHPRAQILKPFRPGAVNKNMPFMVRDYAGKWVFATNDLGADCQGRPIDNTLKNKGRFVASFEFAMQPAHPEWLIPIFHLREPPAAYGVTTTTPSPGYPAQNYGSAPATCPFVITWIPTIDATTNTYVLPANSTIVNGNATTHVQIASATLGGLVTALNANVFLSTLGVWAIDSTGLLLQLTEPAGQTNTVQIFFLEV